MVPRDFLYPVYFLIYSLFSYFFFFLFSLYTCTYLPFLSHFYLSSFFLLSSIRYSFCDLNSFYVAFFLCSFISTSYPLSFPCHSSPVLFSLFLLSCFLHLPFLTFFFPELYVHFTYYILSVFSCFVVRVRLLLIPLPYTSHISLSAVSDATWLSLPLF